MTNTLGTVLKQLVDSGGIRRHMEALEKASNKSASQGLLLPNMIDIVKKTITSLLRLFYIGMFYNCSNGATGSLRETIR